MNRAVLLLTLCCVLFLSKSLTPNLSAAPYFPVLQGKVVGISDGDTIKVLSPERRVYKIRLHGVDCPEKAQAFGQQAKQFTADLSFGKFVKVDIVDQDKYGRYVGIVLLPDGRLLNNELVRAGMAWWYKHYDEHGRELEALEKEARSAKRGLWEKKRPKPPWEFRHS